MNHPTGGNKKPSCQLHDLMPPHDCHQSPSKCCEHCLAPILKDLCLRPDCKFCHQPPSIQSGEEWEKILDEADLEMDYAGCDEPCCGGCTHQIDKSKVKDLISKLRAEAITETEKAFGGCHSCYGKGYSTQIENYSGSGDFVGDKPVSYPADYYLPCMKCDRGKQIAKLIGSLSHPESGEQ